ncbi:MAG: biotin/lipoyl-containing protein [Vicinamibacterales bacterium]
MIFEIEIDGTVRSVSVQPIGDAGAAGGLFQIRIVGPGVGSEGARDPFLVDARPTELGLSLAYPDTGRSVDVAITPRPAGEQLLQLPHVDVRAVLDGRRLRRDGADGGAGTGEQRVAAPMPGRILRVMVERGQEVIARQPLLVMEAMKMENEIRALRAGRVKDISVAAGHSVESGRLLLIIE